MLCVGEGGGETKETSLIIIIINQNIFRLFGLRTCRRLHSLLLVPTPCC